MVNTPPALQVLAEELAFHELRKLGYKILLRNYECALGEIHLVAKKDGDLVFIAVNSTEAELSNQRRAALYYIKRYGLTDVSFRQDTVKVEFPTGAGPVVTVARYTGTTKKK